MGSVALLVRDGRSLKMDSLHAALAVSCVGGSSLVHVPLRCGVLCPAALVSRLLTKQQTSFVGLVAVVSGEQSRQLAGATESDGVFTDAPRIDAYCCYYYYSEGSRYIFLSLEREEEISNRPVLKHGPWSLTCVRVIGRTKPKGAMKVKGSRFLLRAGADPRPADTVAAAPYQSGALRRRAE